MKGGSGRGPITADGCPVEIYLRFPAQGEAEIVHAAIPADATVLDLGCGTGRIAHPLIALGHPVTAVDDSADMLAHVQDATTVHSPIADLHLDRSFAAVLMASHLINTVDDADRRALLRAAARHVAPGGVLVAEQYPPDWFDEVRNRAGGHIGDVEAELRGVRRDGDVVSATIIYRVDGEEWTQTFDARRFDDDTLLRELDGVGLRFERWLSADRSWLLARRPG